jgi:hypothetical protein
VAVTGLLVTTVHGRESRAFERRAVRAQGVIVERLDEQASWVPHVLVRFEVPGHVLISARAPVEDAGRYVPDQSVAVLYDPQRPTHALLDQDRYNAETPFLFWSAVAVGGILPIAFGLWWVGRLRRLATRGGPSFAVVATVAEQRPRAWNRRRPWVTLHPLDVPAKALDGRRPIGSYPLMAGAGVAKGTRLPAEAKGRLRQGGLVVTRVGDGVAWPSGRLHS